MKVIDCLFVHHAAPLWTNTNVFYQHYCEGLIQICVRVDWRGEGSQRGLWTDFLRLWSNIDTTAKTHNAIDTGQQTGVCLLCMFEREREEEAIMEVWRTKQIRFKTWPVIDVPCSFSQKGIYYVKSPFLAIKCIIIAGLFMLIHVVTIIWR